MGEIELIWFYGDGEPDSSTPGDAILLESGDAILLEDGNNILLEGM